MSAAIRKIKIRAKRKPKDARQKKIPLKAVSDFREKKVRAVFLLGGILLVVGSFIISFKSKRSPPVSIEVKTPRAEILSDSFANEPVKLDPGFLQQLKVQNLNRLPPVRIVIPSLAIDLPVKEAKVINGYWEVFPDSAGFGLGSAYPEDNGNQVIFAHARIGMFAPLKKIKTGANITVFTRDKWFSYTVTGIKEVLPNQTEVIAPTTDAVLTLYTCSGYADSKRLIIVSKRNPV